MTAEAAMLALLLERGVCVELPGAYWHEKEYVATYRCIHDKPSLHNPNPYRLPGANRG